MLTQSNPELVGFAALGAAFAVLAVFELVLPFRRGIEPKPRRWATNLGLFAVDAIAVRLLMPLAMIGMAVAAQDRQWGLFNQIDLAPWAEIVAAIVLLDLALYFQHWATHRVPILWRMHRVHHADRDFDVTTAARFHPFEILGSTAYKACVVALFGMAPLAVFLFEAGFAMLTVWTHANLSLPRPLERLVRAAIVTPDMHRIHHSVVPRETDSNYGTVLSGWDRLFGTYRGSARAEQRDMPIGLATYQDARPTRLGWSLWLPFLPSRVDGKD